MYSFDTGCQITSPEQQERGKFFRILWPRLKSPDGSICVWKGRKSQVCTRRSLNRVKQRRPETLFLFGSHDLSGRNAEPMVTHLWEDSSERRPPAGAAGPACWSTSGAPGAPSCGASPCSGRPARSSQYPRASTRRTWTSCRTKEEKKRK